MSLIDQKPPVFSEEEETVFALSDKMIGESLEAGSFDYAANLISRYRSLNRVTDLAVSKTLHGVNRHWQDVDHTDNDDFFQWSVRATGYTGRTVERHISVWEMLYGDYVPEQFKDSMVSHTIRQLFKIYSLVVVPKKSEVNYKFLDQGYVVEDEDWLALSEASDEVRVGEIVHKIKGKPRNKNFMSLKIDKNGDLFVYQGQESSCVGFLSIKDPNPLTQKAIRRILDEAGVTEKDEY